MSSSDQQLEAILEQVRQVRNVDFRNYKRATLRRRIERRMTARRVETYTEYLEILQRDPAEYDALISSMLIKATRFFRDDDIWQFLGNKIIVDLISKSRGRRSLRVWCAGCATGEEAFSIAILLHEALGPAISQFDVKIFGTDIDEAAIAYARRATYSAQQIEGMPSDILDRCFIQGPEGYTVRKEIRRLVVFGVNNLVSDAPISRLDLVLCRNVFIYLDADLQKRIIARFHYALQREGVLILGKSELIPLAGKIFQPIDLTRRIYRKDSRKDAMFTAQERFIPPLQQESARNSNDIQPREDMTQLGRFYRDMLDSLNIPVLATGLDGDVTFWSRCAARFWGRSPAEVLGKKLSILGLPGLSGDLLIDKTTAVREGLSERESADGVVPQGSGRGGPIILNVKVSALRDVGTSVIGLLYMAEDVTALRAIETDVQRLKDELRISYERHKVANEELQSANEELETTNEELQSANEELQTTNEELQSTNEELETTNEELQSTNVELDATNRELAHRTEEMNRLSFYQKTIIRSLSAAIVVLDTHGRITIWNIAAERLLGLAEGEVLGQMLWTLHIPALSRALLARLRKTIKEERALRLDGVSYDLPTGGRGHANIAALPLIEDKANMGAMVIFEDITRAVSIAEQTLKLGIGRKSGKRQPVLEQSPKQLPVGDMKQRTQARVKQGKPDAEAGKPDGGAGGRGGGDHG